MNQKDLLEAATQILKTIKIDAEMAISGEWDKSDDGFQSQIKSIDSFLKRLAVYKNKTAKAIN